MDERIAAVERFSELYAKRSDEMAELITSENGSPLLFSQIGQVGSQPILISGYVEAARTYGWEEDLSGVYGPYTIRREPVGVVAAIPAFNVPQVIILGKLIPALLAGCAVVVKPSPETPLDALLMAEIIHEAGFPEGVISIIPGVPMPGGTWWPIPTSITSPSPDRPQWVARSVGCAGSR